MNVSLICSLQEQTQTYVMGNCGHSEAFPAFPLLHLKITSQVLFPTELLLDS